ncbi:hypothetical protein OE88DRAFT_1656220 [Heliocybe sulcata]|uniref:Xylanolytic transcriptional activator regulatory domain-containing protein n=1 Tax=Heliocybe sulcata TaxID=5364 RepID=A0A5C3N802_9AGAM|nr:hypothetical protein OE88DRAFT_1656220 [Heliocybe sulcata]
MTAIYLTGTHLSPSPSINQHEPTFLSRLRHQLALVPAGLRTTQVTHAIQAEVILAHYLYRAGRVVEARYHSSAAVALALGHRLHKIRAADGDALSGGGEFAVTLPPAQDAIEEGERINGFWTVVLLDKVWAAALGMPPTVGNDEMIDTPFPWDVSGYEQNLVPPGAAYSRTIPKFLSRDQTAPLGGGGSLAYQLQAVILFERASHFAFRQLDNAAQADYIALDAHIDELRQILFPLDTLQTLQLDPRTCMITCSLLHLATLKLHSRFIPDNTAALNKCLGVASNLVATLEKVDMARVLPVNAITGMLCYLVSQEIIRYLTIIPTLPPASRPLNYPPDRVLAMLTSLTSGMEIFGADCPLTVSQLAELRGAYSATP